MAQAEMLKFIEGAGITYTAQFVPFSKSRNAKPIKSATDLSLNWKVSIAKNNRVIVTDYMQGIAHCPGYEHRITTDVFEGLKRSAETGKCWLDRRGVLSNYVSRGNVPDPKFADVLYCLASDASVIDCASFEEWAPEVGYDPDSREGERVYKTCLKQALELRAMLGEKLLAELRAAAQDY